MTTYMLIFASALALAIGGTPIARKLAPRLGVMDQPSARKIHTRPMPRLGGVAIYLAFILALLIFEDRHYISQLVGILTGATLISFCGIWDDRWGLRPLLKLGVGQPLAALILIASGVRVSFLHHPVLNLLVTVFWVVGITSALNLLDNMDGLSAGVATVASAFFLLLAAMNGQYLVGSLAAALLGACLGFLFYNFNPASIFMGDTGSMFIGFILAAVGIKLRFPGRMDVVTWMIPVVILGVPIFDTTLVVVSRLRRGLNPITHPGKDHLSHRLVAMGMTQREAVMAIYLICGGLGLVALFLTQASVVEGYAVAAALALLGLFGLWKLEQVKGL
ncbi:MAG TPA: undecaprenyl/decaprenyl-phosphate alpha-N-acetylglucosaminyl 1-phosphate transferase [Chloroflexi bacterium]|nr:undecaprenyl/decaprenyl-phosphate alpha-N-acetylglucosaminyl 1-phosphate transferase [Chloroflexota bacterium]